MKYRRMGKWGLQVSVVGLGSWYTLDAEEEASRAISIYHAAYDAGINFFDTANVYTRDYQSGRGDAEVLLGKALADFDRSTYVICTKIGNKMGTLPNQVGLSSKYIVEQAEGSLRRLGMDHIDIMMCHRPNKFDAMEETVRAMDRLVQQGKICYWGISNWNAWRIVKAFWTADRLAAAPPAVNEPRYSLLYRYPEIELFPGTADLGMGHVVFSPLAQGLLTGKYPPGEAPPPDSRAADDHDGKYLRKLYYSEENKQRCAEMAQIARDMGVEPGQLAIAWTLANPLVTSAICGATRPEQVRQNAAAADVEVPADVMARLEELFPVRRDRWLLEGEIPTLTEEAE